MTPVRIQRSRKKGWRMPENTVYVGRPTKWGNPFEIGRNGSREECVAKYRELVTEINIWTSPNKNEARNELRGKNLACFCPLDQPCHGDVLLELANLPRPGE